MLVEWLIERLFDLAFQRTTCSGENCATMSSSDRTDRFVLCLGVTVASIAGLASVAFFYNPQLLSSSLFLSYFYSASARGKERAAAARLSGGGGEDAENRDTAHADLAENVAEDIALPSPAPQIIREPVVLCATGQVYCYNTLRDWFRTGNRLCPKTNIEVLDAQVTKLPWLKQMIRAWCNQNSVPFAPSEDSTERLRAIHPSLPGWINDIRTDTGAKRVRATAELYELLRQWEGTRATSAEVGLVHHAVREAVMDEMVRKVFDVDKQGITNVREAVMDEMLRKVGLTSAMATALPISGVARKASCSLRSFAAIHQPEHKYKMSFAAPPSAHLAQRF
eukprot:gene16536-22764_t